MHATDIYDQMPDGDAQRANNQRRLAELERGGAERRRRIAAVFETSQLAGAAYARGARVCRPEATTGIEPV